MGGVGGILGEPPPASAAARGRSAGGEAVRRREGHGAAGRGHEMGSPRAHKSFSKKLFARGGALLGRFEACWGKIGLRLKTPQWRAGRGEVSVGGDRPNVSGEWPGAPGGRRRADRDRRWTNGGSRKAGRRGRCRSGGGNSAKKAASIGHQVARFTQLVYTIAKREATITTADGQRGARVVSG